MADTIATGNGIMTRLREETAQLHSDTEQGRFQGMLMAGKLPLDAYVASLEQLLLVHRALEAHLQRHAALDTNIKHVLRDYQYQEPYLLEDLAHFGRKTDEIKPLPATEAFIREIDRFATSCPIALLGAHYVFEGSNNGGKYIAKGLSRVYDLNDGKGLKYLDPYGDNQKAYWQEFKSSMEATNLSDDDQNAIVKAAKDTFGAILRIHNALADHAANA